MKKDLLSIDDLTIDEIHLILNTTEAMREIGQRPIKKVPTLRATKEMIRRVLAKRRLAPGDDADMVEMCYTSADFREGVTAFLAKRKPTWSGT